MHDQFVAPQEAMADVVLTGDFGREEIDELAGRVRARMEELRNNGARILRRNYEAAN